MKNVLVVFAISTLIISCVGNKNKPMTIDEVLETERREAEREEVLRYKDVRRDSDVRLTSNKVYEVTLRGMIGIYPVVMNLKTNARGKISEGDYYYVSQGSERRISLSTVKRHVYDYDGLVLEEILNGQYIGAYLVDIWNLEYISGTWFNLKGKRYPFKLEVTDVYERSVER